MTAKSKNRKDPYNLRAFLNNGTAKSLQNHAVKLNQSLDRTPTPENNRKLVTTGYKSTVSSRKGASRNQEKVVLNKEYKASDGTYKPFFEILSEDPEKAAEIVERARARSEGDAFIYAVIREALDFTTKGKELGDFGQFQEDVKVKIKTKESFGEFGFKMYSDAKG